MLWGVKAVELSTANDFSHYGILPRTAEGSIGIFLAPFIHGDIFHLISNTFPLIFLGIGLFYFYRRIAWEVIIAIYLISGFWVWLTAREAYHIGASGIVYGLIFFLMVSGFIRKNVRTLAISFIVMTLYGGNMFYGVIPVDNGVSWESHLMGAISGIFLAFYFKKTDLETVTSPSTRRESSIDFTGSEIYRYSIKEEKDTADSKTFHRSFHYKYRNGDEDRN